MRHHTNTGMVCTCTCYGYSVENPDPWYTCEKLYSLHRNPTQSRYNDLWLYCTVSHRVTTESHSMSVLTQASWKAVQHCIEPFWNFCGSTDLCPALSSSVQIVQMDLVLLMLLSKNITLQCGYNIFFIVFYRLFLRLNG